MKFTDFKTIKLATAPATGDNPPTGAIYEWHTLDGSNNLIINYRLPDGIDKTFSAGGKSGVCLSPFAFGLGTNNIIGGYAAKIATYINTATGGATAYRLTLEADNDLDMTKFVAGQAIYINANSMDANSPQVKTIAGVNVTNNFVYLDSDLVCDPATAVIGYDKIALSGYAVMSRTSTASNAIATGSKTFTYASTVLGWALGMRLKATGATATNWMSGIVTAFSATSVTINVDLVSGTGTFASWTLDLAGVGAMVGSACRFTAAAVDDFRVGQSIMIVPTAVTDTAPLQANTIMYIDAVSNYIYLSSLPSPTAVSYALSGYPAAVCAVSDSASTSASFSSGDTNMAVSDYATAEGSTNIACGLGAHAEGLVTSALGESAHAEGSNCVAIGTAAHAEGSGNIAQGIGAHAEGISNKSLKDGAHAEGTGNQSNGFDAHAGGSQSKANGRASFAHGSMCEASGDYAIALGYRTKASAKYSCVIGINGELINAVENEGAYAIAGGVYPAASLAFVVRSRKAVANPLYPADGENQYLPVEAYTAQFKGRLIGTTQTVTTSGSVTLDHDFYSRWKVTPSDSLTPVLGNWQDGDTGELIVLNGGSLFQFPSAWTWRGVQPTLKTTGVDSFLLEQIGSDIFIVQTWTK